jgi:hypothetical protein
LLSVDPCPGIDGISVVTQSMASMPVLAMAGQVLAAASSFATPDAQTVGLPIMFG